MIPTRYACLALDEADPLGPLRARFALSASDRRGSIYLDGNSLGALPAATARRVQHVVEEEWGDGLVRSWNTAGWIDLAQRIGGKIARLVGAGPGEVAVGDSTSVNLFKVLSAAVAIAGEKPAGRRRIVSERSSFPSDLYIAETVARAHGFDLVLAETHDLPAHLDDRLAVLLLTHVNYRTGRLHAMDDLTRRTRQAGGLTVWDLAHSVGVMPIRLHGATADEAVDFAVGCGYKYLNGGPGAPSFLWAHPAHTARMDREHWRQPLSGWFGHAAPFEFDPAYRPAPGVGRFLCGTPPVVSLAALECGVDEVLAAEAYGGLAALRQKSSALTALFIDLVEARCGGFGLELITPRAADARGSQVAFAHGPGGYAIVQALAARHVIADFRAPDILRFGFSPLYTRFADVWDAVERLSGVLARAEWQHPRFAVRAAVT